MTEIKFCGMTRVEDASAAAALGARYVGVIFAGGPRQVSLAAAMQILESLSSGTSRAAVFAGDQPREIERRATSLGLGVVQLHADPRAADVDALRAVWGGGEIWAALRVSGTELPPHAAELFAAADAVVLDARSDGTLGGSGVTLPWERLAEPLSRARRGAKLVLAGGLRAGNVGQAIRCLAPDVVDVSSGVEAAVGIKDPARMRKFQDAVNMAETRE